MEITRKNLLSNGWEFVGDVANRDFYSKGNYLITEHNGIFSDSPKQGTFGGDVEFKTMEEINAYYKDKTVKKIQHLEKLLLEAKEELKLF